MVNFTISGSSAYEYSVTVSKLIVASITSIPSPNLKLARLSDSGASLVIFFDTDTDYAAMTVSTSWNCTKLFLFSSSSLSTCTWVNRTTVIAQFPSYSVSTNLVEVGSSVTLRSDKVKSTCYTQGDITCSQSSYSSKQTISVVTADNPITPTVLLKIPSAVSACSNLTIDPTGSSGNGGRNWESITWSVSSKDGATSAAMIQSYLKSVSGSSITSKITVDSSGITAGTYFVTLILRNFFDEQSSKTESFTFGLDSNIPQLRIDGSQSLSKTPSQSLSLSAYTELSTCATLNVSVGYQWLVYQDSKLTSLTSTSKNPLKFTLPAYSLSSGSRYELMVVGTTMDSIGTGKINSTASVFVTVSSGVIVPFIKGGSVRWISSDLTLDASASYDQDSSDTSLLEYEWSCSLTNALNFGESCDDIFNGTINTLSTVTVYYDLLNTTKSYSVTVTVSSIKDGRSADASVTVYQQVTTTPAAIQIQTVKTVINEDSQLYLDAALYSDASLSMIWIASIDNVVQAIGNISLSPTERNFTQSQLANSIAYPLILPSYSFTGGVTVAFRISAYKRSYSTDTTNSSRRSLMEIDQRQLESSGSYVDTLVSYAEISFRVNTPPTLGSVIASPVNGTALVTLFSFTTYGWIDDASDLPFSYDFRYALSTSATALYIKSRTEDNTASTILPSGLSSNYYKILITARAYDVYLAAASYTTQVYSTPLTTGTTVDYKTILTTSLSSAVAVQSVDSLVAVINAVSTTMNSVNCSLASVGYCASRNRNACENTPNTCSSCYTGYVGIVGDSNAPCFSQSNPGKSIGDTCTSNAQCLYNECSNNVCVAPTQTCPSITTAECSGHGTCLYYVSGKLVPASSCSILNTYCTPTCSCDSDYGGRSCEYSTDQLAAQQQARVLMCEYLGNATNLDDHSTSLVDSLSASLYSTYTPYEVTSDSGVSTCASSLSTLLTIAASGYLDISISSTYESFTSSISEFVKAGNSSFLSNATSLLTDSILQQMGGGQNTIDITSDNLKLSLSRPLATELYNSTLSVPKTTAELTYGVSSMALQLLGDAQTACDDGSGYASISVGGWSVSPFANASLLDSGVFRSETYGNVSSTTSSRRRRLYSSSNYETVAYYLSFPFTQTQDLGQAYSIEELAALTEYNVTFPECNQYTTDVTSIDLCNQCNVSTYTNMSVTFVCYDLQQICAFSSSLYTNDSNSGTTRRNLQVGDDDTTVSESTGVSMLYQTAALLAAIAKTIASTLSFNIFAIDLDKAKVVLSFVGLLFITFVGGIIFFYRWDREDRYYVIYVDKQTHEPDMDTGKRISRGNGGGLFGKKKKKISRRRKRYQQMMQLHEWKISKVLTMIDRALPLRALIFPAKKAGADGVVMDEQENGELDNTQSTGFRFDFYDQIIFPIINFHEYAVMFGDRSISNTRTLRFVNICVQLFFSLFIDTLFFSIFYPDNGTCELMITEYDCTLSINSITAQPTCRWTSSTTMINGIREIESSCSLNPPPNNIAFSVVLSAVTMMISVPISMAFDYVRLEICAKRPDLDRIGVNTLEWLGIPNYLVIGDEDDGKEERSFLEMQKMFERMIQDPNNTIDSSSGKMSIDSASMHSMSQAGSSQHGDSTTNVNGISSRSMMTQVLKSTTNTKFESELQDRSTGLVYSDLFTIEEERDNLIEMIKQFYNVPSHRVQPLRRVTENITNTQAKILAIQNNFGIDVNTFALNHLSNDSQESKQSIIARVWNGFKGLIFSRDRYSRKVLKKLNEARIRSSAVANTLIPAVCDDAAVVDVNVELLQTFILEQLPPFQRYALRFQCFIHPSLSPMMVNPVAWICGWIFLLGSCLFFLYWMLTWCLSSGNTAFKAWGVNFAISFIQDVCLIQLFKVYFLYIATTSSTVPHLKAIYHALRRVAIAMHSLKENEALSLDPLRVVQHLSASCRVARKKQISKLPAAKLLRCLDDLDILNCKHGNFRAQMGIFTTAMLFVPVIAMRFGDNIADSLFETVFPAIVTSVFVSFCLLLAYSVQLFIIVVVIVGFFSLSRSFVSYLYLSSLATAERMLMKHTLRDTDRKSVVRLRRRPGKARTRTFEKRIRMLYHYLHRQIFSMIIKIIWKYDDEYSQSAFDELKWKAYNLNMSTNSEIRELVGIQMGSRKEYEELMETMDQIVPKKALLARVKKSLPDPPAAPSQVAPTEGPRRANSRAVPTRVPVTMAPPQNNPEVLDLEELDSHKHDPKHVTILLPSNSWSIALLDSLGLSGTALQTMSLVNLMTENDEDRKPHPHSLIQASSANRSQYARLFAGKYVNAIMRKDPSCFTHEEALAWYDLTHRRCANSLDCAIRAFLIHYDLLTIVQHSVEANVVMPDPPEGVLTTSQQEDDELSAKRTQCIEFVQTMLRYRREFGRYRHGMIKESTKRKRIWKKFRYSTISLTDVETIITTWCRLFARNQRNLMLLPFNNEERDELIKSCLEWYQYYFTDSKNNVMKLNYLLLWLEHYGVLIQKVERDFY